VDKLLFTHRQTIAARRDRRPINFTGRDPFPGFEFKKSKRTDRAPCGHIDPDAVRHGELRANRACMCSKCVGEVNVIDPLPRRLKQKRSQVHKRAIFFMNRCNWKIRAIAQRRADFCGSRSLAPGAVV
jgi:hypothetical protein